MKKTEIQFQNEIIIKEAWIANNFFSRALGLLPYSSLKEDEAMIFPHCNSVHTFFMRFPLDLILTNEQGVIVEIVKNIKPWRMIAPSFRTKHIIETKSGFCEKWQLTHGNQLFCKDVFK